MMIIAIIVPSIPSMLMCHIMLIIAAITVDSDSIESNSASLPDAISDCEFISSPTFFTYLPSMNLTITATAIMSMDMKSQFAIVGLSIFGIDSCSAVSPAIRIIIAIITDEKYSILP